MIHVGNQKRRINNNYDHVAHTLAYLFILFIIHLNPLMRQCYKHNVLHAE